jgi:hypothetical protein
VCQVPSKEGRTEVDALPSWRLPFDVSPTAGWGVKGFVVAAHSRCPKLPTHTGVRLVVTLSFWREVPDLVVICKKNQNPFLLDVNLVFFTF